MSVLNSLLGLGVSLSASDIVLEDGSRFNTLKYGLALPRIP